MQAINAGVKHGVVPHYGFLTVRAPGTSIQHQLQLATCKDVATGKLQGNGGGAGFTRRGLCHWPR